MTKRTPREALAAIANLGCCARAKTPTYKLFQEAIDIATADTTDWQPIETAPDDGTLFDAMRDGQRWTDCHKRRGGGVVRVHSYLAVTTLFIPPPTHWMPRPAGLVDPYTGDTTGKALPDD